MEPETAALGPLEVPVEPRAAAVEHVAAPVYKGSSPSEALEALFFSRGLVFSPSSATTLPHFDYAWFGINGIEIFFGIFCMKFIVLESIVMEIYRMQ